MNTSLSNSVCSSPFLWADSELWIVGASCWGEGGEEREGEENGKKGGGGGEVGRGRKVKGREGVRKVEGGVVYTAEFFSITSQRNKKHKRALLFFFGI